MKWFVLLVCFLVACGTATEDTCVGPDGEFVGVPTLEANSCLMVPSILRPTTLDTAGLTEEQQTCGWTELFVENSHNGQCTRTVSHRLDVKEDRYVGFIILEINCGEGYVPCASLWRVEFKPLPGGS